MIRFLYNTRVGRCLLKPLCSRTVSRIAGRFLDSKASKPLIRPFIKKYGIDMYAYFPEEYATFNAFFTRRIRPECRPFDELPESLCSPCDGLLSAYRIDSNSLFAVKQSVYSVGSLLADEVLAGRYVGGICLVFRLCVDHYHRYHYIDNGSKTENHFIPGKLHTVRPIALESCNVYTENCREYCTLHTDNFGEVVQIEVGAMLVGRIDNNDGAKRIKRGTEKGKFLYGGSTVILLFEKDHIRIPENIFWATERGDEIPVLCGEKLGVSIKHKGIDMNEKGNT